MLFRSIDGILFRIVDTAGLRTSIDIVEAEGIKRSEKEIESADLVLFILDSMDGITSDDISLLNQVKNLKQKQKQLVYVFNKTDLVDSAFIDKEKSKIIDGKVIEVSAKTHSGFDSLRRSILDVGCFGLTNNIESSFMITSQRHRDALIRTSSNLSRANQTMLSGASNELIAIDIREGLSSLAEITGEVSTDDILNNIFSRFCIGK